MQPKKTPLRLILNTGAAVVVGENDERAVLQPRLEDACAAAIKVVAIDKSKLRLEGGHGVAENCMKKQYIGAKLALLLDLLAVAVRGLRGGIRSERTSNSFSVVRVSAKTEIGKHPSVIRAHLVIITSLTPI